MFCDCGSDRIASVSAKCSDRCTVTIGDIELEGYVPSGLGIGDGDYIRFEFCLECGLIQGDFPVKTPREDEDEDEDEGDEESSFDDDEDLL